MKTLKRPLVSLLTIGVSFSAQAVKLSDYKPFEYKVIFTNPVCKSHSYPEKVKTTTEVRLQKERKMPTVNQQTVDTTKEGLTIHTESQKWINDPKTEEFYVLPVFSKKTLARELCKAVEERNVKIIVIDQKNKEKETRNATANFFLSATRKTSTAKSANKPKIYYRGHTGREK